MTVLDLLLTRRGWLVSFFALPGLRLLAQQPDARYSTQVDVVNVLATVRDKQGHIVRDLTKADFTLTEDGRPQVISYFSPQADLPLTLGLLVDVSQSQRNLLETERRASYRFLDQVLREGKDFAFVIHFAGESELLQDLTASRALLQPAVQAIGNPPPQPSERPGRGRSQTGGQPPRGTGRAPQAGGRGRGGIGGTVLKDAVYLAADELMSKQQGRKALILLSDGVDNGSKVTLDSAIEAAQHADTLVYSLRFYDEEAYRREFPGFGRGGIGGRLGGLGRGGLSGAEGKDALKRISRETGAGFYEPSKKLSVDEIYSQIEEELRNQYSLGYTPDSRGAGGYRKIKLTVKRGGLVVQTRDGYYAR